MTKKLGISKLVRIKFMSPRKIHRPIIRGATVRKIVRSIFLILAAAFSVSFLGLCEKDDSGPIPGDPPPPTYIYPPENGTGQSRTPVFIWNPYKHTIVHRYEIRIGEVRDNGYFFEGNTPGYDTTFTYTDTLEALTEYAWNIKVHDVYDNIRSGPWWHFTTGPGFNHPPLVPYNPDPEDGSSSNPLYATLNWDCYDLDGDPLTYDVWLDTYADDSVLVGDDITDTSIDPGDLEPDRKYYWKVVAFDSHGDSTAGPWWVFKTRMASNKPPIEPWGHTRRTTPRMCPSM